MIVYRNGVWLPLLLLAICLPALPAQGGLPPERPDGAAGAPPVPPPPPKLKMTAWIAYGDRSNHQIPSGFDVPVTVTIDNPDEGFSGKLILETVVARDSQDDSQVTFRTTMPMEIAASQQRVFTISTVIPPRGTALSCKVMLYGDNGAREVASLNAATLVGRDAFTMAVLAEGRKLFSESEEGEADDREARESAERMGMTLEELDEAMGPRRRSSMFDTFYTAPGSLPATPTVFDAMRAVMLYRKAADRNTFSDAHLDALIDYVVGGGSLVLVPCQAPELYSQDPLGVLLPVTDQRPVPNIELPRDLLPKELSLEANRNVPGLLATPRPNATVLIKSADGTPLLVKAPYGMGQVYWFAYDISNRIYSDESLTRLSKALLEDRRTGVQNHLESLRSLRVDETSFLLRAPPRKEILSFLGLYILLLVPVNYLIFSSLGRRELAWIAVPLLAIAFAYYGYIVGFGTRLSEISTYQHGAVMLVRGVEGAPSTPARVLGTTLIYSPNNEKHLAVSYAQPRVGFGLDLEGVLEQGRESLVQDFITRPNGGRVLQDFSVRAKTSRSVRMDGYIDLPGAISATVEPDSKGRLRVTIHNGLEGLPIYGHTTLIKNPTTGLDEEHHEVPHVEVSVGGRETESYTLGDLKALEPGQTAEVIVDPRGARGTDGAPESLAAAGLSIMLTGEIRAELLTPEIDGQKRPSRGARYRLFLRIE